MPCCAVYGDALPTAVRRPASEVNAAATEASGAAAALQLGVPLERPHEPVLCLQEARVHAKSHRGSRRVRGGGATLWQRLGTLTPYNPVWPGGFVRAAIVLPDIADLIEDVLTMAYAPFGEFLQAGLADLQSTHSGRAMHIVFVPLQPSRPLDPAGPTADQFATCCLRIDATMPAQLPYCFLCSRKFTVATTSALHGPASGSAFATASDAAFDSKAADARESSYGAWLSAAFHEIVRTASASSATWPTASSSKRVGGTNSGRLVATAGAVGAGASAASTCAFTRQFIPLGLCSGCLDTVCKLGADATEIPSDSL
jgi:hypothetical protein